MSASGCVGFTCPSRWSRATLLKSSRCLNRFTPWPFQSHTGSVMATRLINAQMRRGDSIASIAWTLPFTNEYEWEIWMNFGAGRGYDGIISVKSSPTKSSIRVSTRWFAWPVQEPIYSSSLIEMNWWAEDYRGCRTATDRLEKEVQVEVST